MKTLKKIKNLEIINNKTKRMNIKIFHKTINYKIAKLIILKSILYKQNGKTQNKHSNKKPIININKLNRN